MRINEIRREIIRASFSEDERSPRSLYIFISTETGPTKWRDEQRPRNRYVETFQVRIDLTRGKERRASKGRATIRRGKMIRNDPSNGPIGNCNFLAIIYPRHDVTFTPWTRACLVSYSATRWPDFRLKSLVYRTVSVLRVCRILVRTGVCKNVFHQSRSFLPDATLHVCSFTDGALFEFYVIPLEIIFFLFIEIFMFSVIIRNFIRYLYTNSYN